MKIQINGFDIEVNTEEESMSIKVIDASGKELSNNTYAQSLEGENDEIEDTDMPDVEDAADESESDTETESVDDAEAEAENEESTEDVGENKVNEGKIGICATCGECGCDEDLNNTCTNCGHTDWVSDTDPQYDELYQEYHGYDESVKFPSFEEFKKLNNL